MELETPELITIGVVGIIVIIIYITIPRAVFEVKKKVRQTDAQIGLLIKIAEKLGVSKDDIKSIENLYNRP